MGVAHEFGRKFAEAIGDCVDALEIWNEEDAYADPVWEYAPVLRSVFHGVRSACPAMRVAHGSFAYGITTGYAEALVARLEGAPATVWASGLDDLPLRSSRHVLVTHLTEVQNSGSSFDDDERKVLLDWGKLPHLMRAGRADISLTTTNANATVWGLASDGTRRCEIPCRMERGVLRFIADIARDRSDATYLYEIVFTDKKGTNK